MFEWLKIKPTISVGIDIDDNSVKILELRKTRTEICVESYAIYKNADISALVKPYSKKFVTIGIPYSAVINKTIQLDAKLNEEEIENYLVMNMKKLTGFAALDISMDFKILEKTSTNKINVELIAARREQVLAKTSLLEKVKVKAIDVESFALQRAALLQLHNNNDIIAAINLKTNNLLLCIFQQENIIYVKEENISEQNIAQLINKELQLFFATKSFTINQIIIAGETVKVELLDSIYNETNIPTTLANPFSNMTFKDKTGLFKIASALTLCCGLALWKFAYD